MTSTQRPHPVDVACSEMATTLTTTLLPGAPTMTIHTPPTPAPSGMCAKCGERHATQSILTIVEHPGLMLGYCDECARGPQWSTAPPGEPGWYWRRRQIRKLQDKFPDDVYGAPHIVRVYSKDGTQWDDFGEIPTTGDEFLQWWPVRIEPPR